MRRGAVNEALAAFVLQVVVVPLHVEDVEVGPEVAVPVDQAGVAGPALVRDAGRLGHVGEAELPGVAVEARELGAVGEVVAREGVGAADVGAAAADLLGRVLADVDQEDVEQAVAVVVEEDRPRGVADVAQARLRGDVLELALAVVLVEDVALAHGGDVEVGVAVVVHVGEGAGDADAVGHRHAGLAGDVLELAAAQVLPQLVVAELGEEVEVEQAVAVHVGHQQAVAVVVVDRLVGLAGVVDDLVLEGDAALGLAVGVAEVVEDLPALGRRDLRVAPRRQAGHPGVDRRMEDLLRLRVRRRLRRRSGLGGGAVVVLGRDGRRQGAERQRAGERERESTQGKLVRMHCWGSSGKRRESLAPRARAALGAKAFAPGSDQWPRPRSRRRASARSAAKRGAGAVARNRSRAARAFARSPAWAATTPRL